MASQDVTGDEVRAVLERERAELNRQIDELDIANEGAVEFDENFADSGQVAAEQGENLVLIGNFRDQLAEVEAAIERLDDGSYGKCQECGRPIGDARLEAMPSTRFCIDHA